MKISENALKALRELGLTEYETSAYLALVDGGKMAASDISSESGVPYSRIYDVLGRLEEKGFIQIQRGRPTLYIAKAPTEVVRLVRLNLEEKLDRSSKLVVDELQPLYEEDQQVTSRDVFVIHGRSAILAKAIEMVNTAREQIKLSVPSLDLETEDIDAIIDRVLDVRTKNVSVLTSDVPESMRNMIPNGFHIRTRERVFGAGLVVDERQTLIMLAGGEKQQYLGVYSNHAVFAAMASAYFDSLWQESKPLS